MQQSVRDEFLLVLSTEVLNEENTDKLIDAIFDRISLPWWVPTAVAKRVLDRLLPETLLKAIQSIV